MGPRQLFILLLPALFWEVGDLDLNLLQENHGVDLPGHECVF